MIDWIRTRIKRLVVGTIGMIVLILGVIGFLNPLPFGIILLPMGFLILGTQFPWAKRILRRIESSTGPVGRKIGQAEKRAARYMKKMQKRLGRDNKKSKKVVKTISDLPQQYPKQKKRTGLGRTKNVDPL